MAAGANRRAGVAAAANRSVSVGCSGHAGGFKTKGASLPTEITAWRTTWPENVSPAISTRTTRSQLMGRKIRPVPWPHRSQSVAPSVRWSNSAVNCRPPASKTPTWPFAGISTANAGQVPPATATANATVNSNPRLNDSRDPPRRILGKLVIDGFFRISEGVPYRRGLFFGQSVGIQRQSPCPCSGRPHPPIGNYMPGNILGKWRPLFQGIAGNQSMFAKLTEVDRKPQALPTGNSPGFRHVAGLRRRKWLKASCCNQVSVGNALRTHRGDRSMSLARRALEHRCWAWPATLTLCCLTAAVGTPDLLQAQQPTPPASDRLAAVTAPAASATRVGPKQPRIREGTTLVEQAGVFQTAGDRVTFLTSDGQRRFVVLENLQLERILRAVGESLTPPQWTVSATVTEFCGANYLFVDRAVLRATVPSGGKGPRPWADPRAASLPHSPPAHADRSLPATAPVKP